MESLYTINYILCFILQLINSIKKNIDLFSIFSFECALMLSCFTWLFVINQTLESILYSRQPFHCSQNWYQHRSIFNCIGLVIKSSKITRSLINNSYIHREIYIHTHTHTHTCARVRARIFIYNIISSNTHKRMSYRKIQNNVEIVLPSSSAELSVRKCVYLKKRINAIK